MSDARDRARRYADQRAAGQQPDTDAEEAPEVPFTAQNKAAFVETAIQQAIRRGEFDNLPGAGKPLEGLGTHHDPDWWIRRKIASEDLSGLGPAALLLRNEDRALDETLDDFTRESDVREHLADFNKRVVEARRQLQGGPPVVTRTRDIDAEVVRWQARREARAEAAAAATRDAETAASRPKRRWFRR